MKEANSRAYRANYTIWYAKGGGSEIIRKDEKKTKQIKPAEKKKKRTRCMQARTGDPDKRTHRTHKKKNKNKNKKKKKLKKKEMKYLNKKKGVPDICKLMKNKTRDKQSNKE